MQKKLTGIYFTIETLKKLKIYAAEKMVSVSTVVEEAVKEFIEKQKR